MTELHLVYATLGAGAVLLVLVSRRLRDLPLSEPLLALLLGIVLGPQLLDLVDVTPELRDPLLLELSRLLLAASVMAAALRFPYSGLRPLLAPVALLLVVVMPLAAVVSGAGGLLLGLPVALAALLGACLCPTDPVLAADVVSGEKAESDLPSRVRALLTGESGSNDGLALPLVGAALVAVLPSEHWGDALPRLLWEVAGGTVIGVVLGVAAGHGMRWATKERELDRGPELVFTLVLAVAVLGVARVAGTDGVLAVFVAGLAYNRGVSESERGPQEGIDEAVNRYAVLPLFVLLGVVLPWEDWLALGPAALLFVLVVLGLRRLPFVLALARPLGLGRREAVFAGWFGPMGVSAIFYLAHSIDKGADDPRLFAAGTLAVAASVVAFGLSGSPGRRLYARDGASREEASAR